MRNRLVSTLFIIMTFVPGMCVAQQGLMKVDVPFAFQVGTKELPAGKYTVRRVSQAAIALTSEAGKTQQVTLIIARDWSSKVEPKLLFQRIGDKHYLTQVSNELLSAGVVRRAQREEFGSK